MITSANYLHKVNDVTVRKFSMVLRSLFVSLKHVFSSDLDITHKDALELSRLANRMEVDQPNLAVELRFIAARG